MDDFHITLHARQRFLERKEKKYSHLSNCRGCHRCVSLTYALVEEVKNRRAEVEEEIMQRLKSADEVKSYLNNTEFMQWYFDKYGFDKRFQFLVDKDLVFVIVYEEGRRVVVTCVYSKSHVAGASKRKFKKKVA